jgi:aspartyl-tRNA(Asn)/glutamyl-tRNA(Gln) amidotransferase subunit C
MQSTSQTPEQVEKAAEPEPVPLEQVLRVAELAQLELREDEQQEMLRDLNAILGHVAQLNELDTHNVPPMTQVHVVAQGDAGHAAAVDAGNVLRDDSVRPSLDRAKVMASAPETEGTYFKVPKVIER